MTKIINLAFVIRVFTTTKIVNIYKKNITFDAKNIKIKHLAKSKRKYY